MKRAARLLAGLALVAFLLAGCGYGESSSDETAFDLPDGANPYEPGALLGTSLSAFPDTGGVNQFGEPVSFESLPEKPVALSVMYTRCPNPNMCPLVTWRMRQLQKTINSPGERPVHFVLISLDPEHDQPPVLKRYADKRNIDYETFDLWTGPPEVIHQLLSRLKVITMGNASESISHNVRLYLLDNGAVVRYYWRGTDWTVEDVAKRLRELASS